MDTGGFRAADTSGSRRSSNMPRRVRCLRFLPSMRRVVSGSQRYRGSGGGGGSVAGTALARRPSRPPSPLPPAPRFFLLRSPTNSAYPYSFAVRWSRLLPCACMAQMPLQSSRTSCSDSSSPRTDTTACSSCIFCVR